MQPLLAQIFHSTLQCCCARFSSGKKWHLCYDFFPQLIQVDHLHEPQEEMKGSEAEERDEI